MSDKPTLLLFASAGGPSEIEQVVTRAQWVVGLETIEKLLKADCCERLVVATNADGFVEQLGELPVIVERDSAPFHFGSRLRELIRKYDVQRPLYVGAGSAALFSQDDFTDLCARLMAADRAVISNNLFSTDFAGFVPGEAIEGIDPPAIDNNLAFLLNRQVGLPELSLPRTASSQFDIDTPSDLLILSLHPAVGKRARTYLDSLGLENHRMHALMEKLTDDRAEVVVCGRVSSSAWAYLERDTACRIRMFSEERGMRASGREERGAARSLLGFYLERCGAHGLFDALRELGDAAIIDSRVIFQHLGLRLSAPDRFYSDLLQPEHITDPVAREFTAAAREARIPVLLGGHSVVAGGLWALIDAAWQKNDRNAGTNDRRNARP
ncbi:MAG: hypothetical protein M1482_07955 [Chloroflexi bacterium]|nr:hypothetical protein [Chloroflexota bacterium]